MSDDLKGPDMSRNEFFVVSAFHRLSALNSVKDTVKI